MDEEELLRRYAAGERDFSKVILKYINLSGANLSEAFMGSQLRGVNFRYAKMIGIEMAEADLTSADLRDTDLRDSDLAQSCLDNVDLTNADLRDAFLEEISGSMNLSNANLFGAKIGCVVDGELRDSILCNTIMPDGSIRNDGNNASKLSILDLISVERSRLRRVGKISLESIIVFGITLCPQDRPIISIKI